MISPTVSILILAFTGTERPGTPAKFGKTLLYSYYGSSFKSSNSDAIP